MRRSCHTNLPPGSLLWDAKSNDSYCASSRLVCQRL
jgi:hypothetical protein